MRIPAYEDCGGLADVGDCGYKFQNSLKVYGVVGDGNEIMTLRVTSVQGMP
jgi:hypothetical protein